MRFYSHFQFVIGLSFAIFTFAKAHGETRCPDSFANFVPYDQLQKVKPVSLRADQMLWGHHYVVQFVGGIDTFDVQFLRREGDEIIYRVGKVEQRRPATDFHEIRTLKDAEVSVGKSFARLSDEGPIHPAIAETPPTDALHRALESLKSAYQSIADGTRLSPLLIAPTKQIAQFDSVKVIGSITATKSVGLELAHEITTYDSTLTKLGFQLPSKTTVVLNDHPVLPSLLGPTDFPSQIRIPGRGAAENTLIMNPIGRNKQAASDTTILRHERAHSVLFATYNDQAFVNESDTVQEALADFLSAHVSGNPVIGANAALSGKAIRDISTREVSADLRGPRVYGARPVTSLMDVQVRSDHANSLLLSNALWRVRETIGTNRMNDVLKPLVDDLNLHHASGHLDGSYDSVTRARSVIEYGLASFRKTLADRNVRDGVKQIDQLANELGITESRIANRSAALVRAGDFNFDGTHQSPVSIVLMHAPAAVVVGTAGAVIIYTAKTLRPEATINMIEPRER